MHAKSDIADAASNACREEGLQHLMAGYQQADRHAATLLVECLSPMLYRFIAQQPSTRSIAEDLLQECWLRIHRSRHSYREGSPVLPWVFAIARRTRIDGFRRYCRKEMREVPFASEYEMRSEPAVAPGGKDDVMIELTRHMSTLTASERETIHVLKVQGLSLKEASAMTGASVNALKQRAHRAYIKLKSALGGQP